jgi:sialic acid synthase SpsE
MSKWARDTGEKYMSEGNAANTLLIGDTLVGDGQPIYIMADLGLTNGGDIDRAFDLIDIASAMGVDAVKFQMIGPETLLGDKTAEYTYPTLQDGKKTENMFEMFSDLSYSESQWGKIADYTRSKDLEFICTAHYMGAVPMLENIGVNIHKICTWSMTHKRLVQSIGQTGKAMMLDTGMFTTETLTRTLDWHKNAGGEGALILHDFHTTDHADMNFRAIPFMKELFSCPVGYTPQGIDGDMDFMSIGLGANILEKRLTTDRAIPKNGHIKALDPPAFETWLKRVKELELALGRSDVVPTTSDAEQSQKFFKSLYVKDDTKKGEVLTDAMLEARRPGTGIPASEVDEVIGRKLRNDKAAETMLDWSDLDDQ